MPRNKYEPDAPFTITNNDFRIEGGSVLVEVTEDSITFRGPVKLTPRNETGCVVLDGMVFEPVEEETE